MKTSFKKFELSNEAQKNIQGGNGDELLHNQSTPVNILKTKHDTAKNSISNIR